MEYMILIGEDERRDTPAPGTPDFDLYMGDWTAYNQKLIDGGHWLGGGRLQPTETATTIRRSAGVDTVVDGPYAETKEQFGGYYIITAADLDEALGLAASMPIDNASLEVRPIAFRPDAM
jgi:hypothetical protein